MRALNDLVIRGPRPELAAFLQHLEGSLTGGWRRDRELEARLHGMGVGGEGAFCFSCTEAPERPAAALWLQARGPEEWHVSNIVPLGRHMLSDEEYNHVLGEFESRFLDPLSRGSAVHSEVLPARTRLENYLSPEAARLLRAFSAAANRTRGYLRSISFSCLVFHRRPECYPGPGVLPGFEPCLPPATRTTWHAPASDPQPEQPAP